MPSGWNIYQGVILSALLALGIPIALGIFSRAISPRSQLGRRNYPEARPALQGASEELRGTRLGRRMNTRFFLGANSSILLITLGLALIPCAAALRSASGESKMKVLLSILSVCGFAVLGLFYSARKGDLNWLTTFKEANESTPEEGAAQERVEAKG